VFIYRLYSPPTSLAAVHYVLIVTDFSRRPRMVVHQIWIYTRTQVAFKNAPYWHGVRGRRAFIRGRRRIFLWDTRIIRLRWRICGLGLIQFFYTFSASHSFSQFLVNIISFKFDLW